jgi:hypothetical protein
MGTDSATLTLAKARERFERDTEGRRAAALALLGELRTAAEVAKLTATLTSDEQTQIVFDAKHVMTLWVDDKAELICGNGAIDGIVDSLVFDPVKRVFAGVWEDETVEAIDALANFVASRLPPSR